MIFILMIEWQLGQIKVTIDIALMYITLLVPFQLTAEISVNSAKVRDRFSYTSFLVLLLTAISAKISITSRK